MSGRWNLFGFQLHKILCAVLMFHLQSDKCVALNLEGLALLEFRARVEIDPYGAFKNWDPRDSDPCRWSGVHCIDGKVVMLDLKELSLGGVLAPELGKLSNLRSLVLYKNNFTGLIPKEFGELTMLEILDLRGNNLNGTIPMEIGEMLSLNCLLLCDNKFQGGTPSWIEKPNMDSDLKYNRNLSCDVAHEIDCINRKIGQCVWQRGLQRLRKASYLVILLKGRLLHFFDMLPTFNFRRGSSHDYGEKHGDNLSSDFTEPFIVQNVHVVNTVRRRLLQESNNLPAAPVSSSTPEVATVLSVGSGSFPAVPISNSVSGRSKPASAPATPTNPPRSSPSIPSQSGRLPSKSTNSVDDEPASRQGLGKWIYVLIFLVVALILIITIMILICQRKGAATIGPWKTGLSGQLQKAFITGVPKLNRSELEAACEDFSNIISTFPCYTMFKGTLSSGVEIAVVSAAAKSAMDWSEQSELHFRNKMDTISRVNHKNFVNLLGYCEENEPFTRMLVFEYAPNGTLFEHLHVKDYEHLDWSARMRAIIGIAYCLQYMHHELNPPVAHSNLQSNSIFITDDFAAKIADISVSSEPAKEKLSGDVEKDKPELLLPDPESNVYCFGILLLEIISGRIPYSEEEGSIVDWAAEYLKDGSSVSSMVDPMLKSSKDNELHVICEVIRECIHHDPKKRPTMKAVTNTLREALGISPEAATPRLSPLWWAELEILSVEAS